MKLSEILQQDLIKSCSSILQQIAFFLLHMHPSNSEFVQQRMYLLNFIYEICKPETILFKFVVYFGVKYLG